MLHLIALVLCGCAAAHRPASSISSPAATSRELETALHRALAALGKDPQRSGSSPPAGADNSVFDLSASLVDAAGQPVLADDPAIAGVRLTWTEQLTGDYDQNGEVNASDLAPLGRHFQSGPQVVYDAAAQHAGFALWPSGDPAAGGAHNWRLARIDGDGNGEIYLPDVSPIAKHWHETLSGYRVYRKSSGQSQFVALGNPADGASVARPAPPVDDAPVRYSFTDHPPTGGLYEYYVAPYAAANGEGAPAAQSVHVSAQLAAGFTDTTVPVWDSTSGITAATANPDRTVTIQFGAATDNAQPPAPASPPVTYTVYYSTESVLNFDSAARVDGITAAPWTSPPLLPGTTYYFAVRARDCATPANEEQNSAELPATIPAGEPVEDRDPPVWTEVGQDPLYPYSKDPGLTQWQTIGFKEIRPGDGKITIVCADASDALNPPVHYDLYYRDLTNDPVYPDSRAMFDNLGNLLPGIQTVHDIPKTYEFPWPNRIPVLLCVAVRDSASPPNVSADPKVFKTAAGRMTHRFIDTRLPGLVDGQDNRSNTWAIADQKEHKADAIYVVRAEHPNVLRFAQLDLATGNWQATEIYREPDPTRDLDSPEIGFSPSHGLWCKVSSAKGWGDSTTHYFKRLASGAWQEWPPGVAGHAADKLLFSHVGTPALFSSAPSATTTGREKLIYKWWDDSAQEWQQEVAADPGGEPQTHLRPDGMYQLVIPTDFEGLGDTSPTKAHICDRDPQGNWTLEFDGYGTLIGETTYCLDDPWDAAWGWAVETNIRGSDELIAATTTGYQVMAAGHVNGKMPFGIFWPSEDGYSAIPTQLYSNHQYRYQSFAIASYSDRIAPAASGLGPSVRNIFAGGVANPADGFVGFTELGYDLNSDQYGLYLANCVPGEDLFHAGSGH